MAQTFDSTNAPHVPPAPAAHTGWFGATTSNLSARANKWLGRNRPATGAGATADVGGQAGALSAPNGPPASQWQPPGSIPALAFNPHSLAGSALSAPGIFSYDGASAPANRNFNGLWGATPAYKPFEG